MADSDPSTVIETPFGPPAGEERLTEQKAVDLLFRVPKVHNWLERYPPKPSTDAEFGEATGDWTVRIWSGEAGQVALGKVDESLVRMFRGDAGTMPAPHPPTGPHGRAPQPAVPAQDDRPPTRLLSEQAPVASHPAPPPPTSQPAPPTSQPAPPPPPPCCISTGRSGSCSGS